MTCREIKALFDGFALVRECEPVRQGWLVLSTQFQYPDGSYVDVYVRTERDSSVLLSDQGNSANWLGEVQVEWWSTPNRKSYVADVCEALSVREVSGELQVRVEDLSELPPAVMRLGLACVRMTDLLITRQIRTRHTFKEEFKEGLLDRLEGVRVRPNITIPGRHRHKVGIDFQVNTARRESLVNTISAEKTSALHLQVDALLAKWIDLKQVRTGTTQLITVFDDRKRPFAQGDHALLREHCDDVIPWSNRGRIIETLVA